MCFQKQSKNLYLGVEDCLYLNVHTPEINNLNPVMVFIHGGSFTEGSGQHILYGPEFLIPNRVVVVTINYRLGFLGFLNFQNAKVDVPGNAALKDQLMALKWVKKNIEFFGGDPNKVTIFGESAGGASVHLQTISKASQGYFQKAIIMSGVGLAPWCDGKINNGVDLAKMLGYNDTNEFKIVEFLQNLNLDSFKTVLNDIQGVIPHISKENFFGPITENNIDNNNTFLTDSPRNLLKQGDFNKIPLMIGQTNQEGLILEILHLIKTAEFNLKPLSYYIPKSFINKPQFENDLNQFYFNQKNRVNSTDQNEIDLNSDTFFIWSIHETIFGHLNQNQTVFFYVFSSDTELNWIKNLFPNVAKVRGASHFDDIGHLFKSFFTKNFSKGSLEDRSVKKFVTLLTNFAKNDDFDDVAKTNYSLNYLEVFNDEVKVGVEPNKERVKFWCEASKKYSSEMVFC
nr:esterase B1-like [Onthophagus taurus]